MGKYALISVNYNRAESTITLLNSLKNADYCGDSVDLIISIDNSGDHCVYDNVKDFSWPYGEKIIRQFETRQGLRKHVLSCGEYLKAYDAVAVFEDDLVVSPGFYRFMVEAVAKYKNDDRIAGISLYKHLWNVNANAPFEPENNGYDVFFMQFAMSWGQIWMKDQWDHFIKWYEVNSGKIEKNDRIPNCVTSWSDSSWLKYHIKYCIDENKYFVYPQCSCTTCCAEVGEHTKKEISLFQVPLMSDSKKVYNLPEFEKAIKYDSFFERVIDNELFGIASKSIRIDLYGIKKNTGERYVITTKSMPYKVIKSFSLSYKPHESNFINDKKGKGIFMYDTTIDDKMPKRDDEQLFNYYYRLYYNPKLVIKSALHRIRKKFFKF